MAAFRFEAFDGQGRLKTGALDAETARAVRDRLRAEGLFPALIEAVDVDRPPTIARTRLPPATLTLVTRQLATLVRSGMPLDRALAAIDEQADDWRVRSIFEDLRREIAAGLALPVALGRWPRTFGLLYRGLVAAAVESGRLPEVLTSLAQYLEAREALRQRLTLALIYPALVTVVALAVITVLLVYVVPQVVSVYQQSRQTLPTLTRALIATSEFLSMTGVAWLVTLVGAAFAFALALRREHFRARWHALLLSIPVLGRLLLALDTARFASTLAILVGSGTPLMRALEAAAAVIALLPIRAAASSAAMLVREGVPLAGALREQRVFPPVLVHLVANGEASGELPAMLDRAAGELERESERRLTWLAALLQPALIVAMGAIVLVLVLAVMLPIVSMNRLIR